MKQEEWTEQLRNRLSDHQEAVPDDLWAGIEAGLDAPVAQRRPAPLWHRWAAAAAVVLLLAGGTMVYFRGEREEVRGEQLEARGEKQEVRSEKQEVRDERVAEALKPAKSSQTLMPKMLETLETPDNPETPENPDIPDIPEVPDTPENPEPPETPEPIAQPENPFVIIDVATIDVTTHDSRRLTAALYAGNGLDNRYNTDRVQMSHDLAEKYYAMNDMMGTRSEEHIWLANFEEREHHERPFTIGLQLRYPLSGRLSLSSGLVYTRLKSEFTKVMKGNEVEQQQQLHYVGLPLGLQYRLWQIGHLGVYASAGGQVDWNVSARMGVNGSQYDIDKDRLQWSLNGAVGLAYDLTPHVALFAEPGFKYYIDNNSPVRNYFKDKPMNFSLQVGMQLNVGKR